MQKYDGQIVSISNTPIKGDINFNKYTVSNDYVFDKDISNSIYGHNLIDKGDHIICESCNTKLELSSPIYGLSGYRQTLYKMSLYGKYKNISCDKYMEDKYFSKGQEVKASCGTYIYQGSGKWLSHRVREPHTTEQMLKYDLSVRDCIPEELVADVLSDEYITMFSSNTMLNTTTGEYKYNRRDTVDNNAEESKSILDKILSKLGLR